MGREALAVRADVFTPDGIAALTAAAEGFFEGGVVDILVNNAGGLNVRGELCDEHMTAEVILENVHMNYVATALMCKAVIPGMKARGFGRIINIGSIAGVNGGSGTTTPHYGPAKAAVHCLGRSLAQTYAKHGVNTNTIAPGVVDNGFHAKARRDGWGLSLLPSDPTTPPFRRISARKPTAHRARGHGRDARPHPAGALRLERRGRRGRRVPRVARRGARRRRRYPRQRRHALRLVVARSARPALRKGSYL